MIYCITIQCIIFINACIYISIGIALFAICLGHTCTCCVACMHVAAAPTHTQVQSAGVGQLSRLEPHDYI